MTELVAHPGVRAISFTGSLETGKLIAAECGRQMKRYSMELGSKNVTIVMPDADLDLAVEGIAWGAFATSGQRCTATSRVVSMHDGFAAALIEKVQTYNVGPGSDETVDLTPLINRAQRDRVLEYIRVGRDEDGARLIHGGQPLFSTYTGGIVFHVLAVLGERSDRQGLGLPIPPSLRLRADRVIE